MTELTIVDYGAGNLRSVENSLAELQIPYSVTNTAAAVEGARKIVLPGVGHFGQMMRALDDLGLRRVLVDRIQAGMPFLGICIGLQCLFESSEESPNERGLGILPGRVKRFAGDARVPHMGWNTLQLTKDSKLLRGLEGEIFTYFAHSYFAPVIPQTAGTCTYMHPYTAVIEQENLFAVQFHPEKSAAAGHRVLQNFAEI